MSLNAHVYQIYIAASPEQCGQRSPSRSGPSAISIRRHSSRRRSGARPTVRSGPTVGRPSTASSRRCSLPQRKSGSFRPNLAHPVRRSSGAGTAEPRGVDGRERRRWAHSRQARARRPRSEPLTWENVKDGWVWILDSMKTLLETGRPLPRVRDSASVAEAVSS